MKTFTETANDILLEIVNRKYGGNVTAAAKALGVSVPSLHTWVSGKRKPKIASIAPLLDSVGAQIVMPGAELDDFAMVPKVAAKAGAGSSLVTDGDVLGYYAFRHSFMNRVHINADSSVLMEVIGESMTPIIMPGDTVLIDKADTRPVDGKIYVVGLDDELLVKRLQKTGTGWALISQNPNFMPIQVGGEQESTFRIYGRVRWYGRIID